MELQVIGDELWFMGFKLADFARGGAPATVREKFEALVREFPDPDEHDEEIADLERQVESLGEEIEAAIPILDAPGASDQAKQMAQRLRLTLDAAA